MEVSGGLNHFWTQPEMFMEGPAKEFQLSSLRVADDFNKHVSP